MKKKRTKHLQINLLEKLNFFKDDLMFEATIRLNRESKMVRHETQKMVFMLMDLWLV